MFEVGKLLRFDPFIFPDGGQPKAKYFIVLHNDGNGVLLATLPTSKDHVPGDVYHREGCLEIPERQVNVFVIPAGKQVTAIHTFQRNTFIYGAALRTYSKAAFECQQIDGKTTIQDLGIIEPMLFQLLIDCLKSSSAVRGRFKKLL